jgi:hypothetical protein
VSHVASGYAKALLVCPNGERLTPAEKLLLMVLADYHNTETKTSYPSVPLLAVESLVDERKARRLLQSLSEKGVINIIHPERQGRGARSEYEFVGLEKGGSNASLFDEKGGKKGGQKEGQKGGQKGGQIAIPNKEELIASAKNIEQALPDWLPLESWNAYLDMRKAKKKNPTEGAIKMILKELDDCRKQGQSVKKILDRSTINSWTGVFPLDNGNHAKPPEKPWGTPAEKAIKEMWGD